MTEKVKAFLRIEKLTTGKIDGYEMWQEIPLEASAIIIGRPSRSPDAISPDIKIVGDDYITRVEHAEIFYSDQDGCFMIKDSKSRNGTFVNEEIIEKNEPFRLKDRDIIGLAKIGGELRVKFRFKLNDETAPPWAEDKDQKHIPEKGLHINVASKKVFVNGHEVSLTKTELKLLEMLYENKGNACSIDDIAWEVWGKEGASDELIAQHVRRLRARIEEDPSQPRYIITVPGKHGCYRLEI
jgi:pSer/pThr/pTyr-binding forkhead associated (FHA) protein